MIYPLKQTCFKSLNWTDINEIKHESISGEAWSTKTYQLLSRYWEITDSNQNKQIIKIFYQFRLI